LYVSVRDVLNTDVRKPTQLRPPLAVQPGVPYVLTWSLKTIGPGGYRAPAPLDEAQRKAFAYWDNFYTALNPEARPFLWHHFVDYLGVELVWQNASGGALAAAARSGDDSFVNA